MKTDETTFVPFSDTHTYTFIYVYIHSVSVSHDDDDDDDVTVHRKSIQTWRVRK